MPNDPNISPSGNTDATDTAAPDSAPATNGTDNTPASDTAPQSSASQPAPTATPAPGQPATNQPGSPQQNPQNPQQKQPDLSKSPQQPSQDQVQQQQQQKQIQHAVHMRNVFEALAGGPRFKETIDPNTGTMQRTKVPMSRGDIGMMIAMEALTGATAGLSERGPGATGRAAGAGFDATAQQAKEAQQQQDQQASADFARHAQVYEANLRMLQLAQNIGQKDFETNQEFAAQYKPLADQVQKEHPEAILGIGSEQDASKYHATKNSAIPTGNVIPVLDPKTGEQAVGKGGNKLWQQEYMFIDPNFKGDNFLSPDDIKIGKKYGIIPPGKLPSSLPMRMSMALNYKNRISAMGLADQDVQSFYKREGKEAPDLAGMVQRDRTLTDALEKFQPLLAATGNNYGKAIGELASGGQGRQPDANAAGKILNLYGGTEMVKKFDQDQANAQEQQKKITDKRAAYDGPLNTQIAESIKDDADATPEQKQRANAFLATDTHHQIGLAASKAGAEATARTQAEINVKKLNGIPLSGGSGNSVKDWIDDPKIGSIPLDPNEKNLTNGVNETFLNHLSAVNPDLGQLVDQLGHGQQMQSAYALAKKDGQVLGSLVARAFPGYQFQKAESFGKMYQSFTSGKDADQIEAANTTYRHIAEAYKTAGNTVLIPGTKSWADYVTASDKALDEVHGAYSKGVQHEEQFERASKAVHSVIPGTRQEGWKEVAQLLSDKSGEKQNTYRRGKPTDKLPNFSIISPDAQDAFKQVTGKFISPSGYSEGSLSANNVYRNYSPPKGSQRRPDGKGGYEYQLPNGQVVNNEGDPMYQ